MIALRYHPSSWLRWSNLDLARGLVRARQVVVLAQDEARALKHNYIGTEHILLGLLREEEGLAARVLESLDITVEEVRAQAARILLDFDADAEKIRNEIIRMLSGPGRRQGGAAGQGTGEKGKSSKLLDQ